MPDKETKRGRPRGFDVGAVTEAAVAAFCERGYAGVSMAEIGEKFDLAPPSLYAAFGSKEQLFEAAIDRYATAQTQKFQAAVKGARDLQDWLSRFLAAAVEEFAARGPCGCLVMETSRAGPNSPVSAIGQDRARRSVAALGAGLVAFLPKEKAADAAQLLAIALTGLSGATRAGASRPDLDAFSAVAAAGIAARFA